MSAKLPFGEYGEITEETIRKAKLTKEEKKLAYAQLEVQKAFLEILDSISFPVDPEGHIHDVRHMEPTRIAIAYTLAQTGFRRVGHAYIKKRAISGAGMYADAHTWVDSRSPDSAAEELLEEHSSLDPRLPPDTRKLAAVRDGMEAEPPDQSWTTKPKIVHEFAPRPED